MLRQLHDDERGRLFDADSETARCDNCKHSENREVMEESGSGVKKIDKHLFCNRFGKWINHPEKTCEEWK